MLYCSAHEVSRSREDSRSNTLSIIIRNKNGYLFFLCSQFSVLEIVDGVSQKKFGVVIFKFGKEWISLIPFPILLQRYDTI